MNYDGDMLSVRDYIFVTIFKLKYVSLEEVGFDPFNNDFKVSATESNSFRLHVCLRLFRPRSKFHSQKFN